MPKKVEGGAKTKSGKSFFGIAIVPELRARLDKHLAKTGMSRNSFIAMAIINELDRATYARQLIKHLTQKETANNEN